MRDSGANRYVTVAAVALLGTAVAAGGVGVDERVLDPLTFALAAGAILANLSAVQYGASMWVSASFTCSMLAVALLGPAAAVAVALLAELGAWTVDRLRLRALAVNAAGSALPNAVAAWLFVAVAGEGARDPGVALAIALATCATVALTLNFTIVSGLHAIESGADVLQRLRPPRELLLPLFWTIALTVAAVEVYRSLPAAGGAVLVLVLLGFTLMARLVAVARSRTEQYTELTVGAVTALLRALEKRDPRAARHAAAVAAFARDVAHAAGLSPRDCELAHTAGLLHDIGRTALADRTMNGASELTRDDWRAIAQHPLLGAALVSELDVPAEVAEAVRAHHERVDGLGYPDGLAGDAIPPIARVVAVAEVYDTLTAGDTYRPRMSSFQAMVELRRVAGSQCDPAFVEALAEVLAGRELGYRHASGAHLDGELLLEDRLADAFAR